MSILYSSFWCFCVGIEGNAMGSKIIHELFLFSDDGYEYEFFFFWKLYYLPLPRGLYICVGSKSFFWKAVD